jgi:hypothetical protein
MSRYKLGTFRPINFLSQQCDINEAALTATPLVLLRVLLLFDIEMVKFMFHYYLVYSFQTPVISFW